jgi:hypothetical protein
MVLLFSLLLSKLLNIEKCYKQVMSYYDDHFTDTTNYYGQTILIDLILNIITLGNFYFPGL